MRGPAVVSVGMAVLGVGSYVFLVAAGRSLSVAEFGRLSVLWSLLFGVVGGLSFAFEQETVRATAAYGVGEDTRRIGLILLGCLVLAEVGILSYFQIGGDASLNDRSIAMPLAFGTLGLPTAAYVRGLLIGGKRFGVGALELGAEGLIRGLLAVVCAAMLLGPGAFEFVLTGAPLVATLAVTPLAFRSRSSVPSSRTWSVLMKDLGVLLAGGGLAIVVLNLGPLITSIKFGSTVAAGFTALFTLARLPVFFSAPVAAALLPRFVVAARSSSKELRRSVRHTVGALAAVLLPVGLLIGLMVPVVVRVLYGNRYAGSTLLAIALVESGIVHLLSLVVQAALVAGGRRSRVVAGWAVGLVVLLVFVFVIPGGGVTRVGYAYLTSALASAAIMYWAFFEAPRA